MSFDPMAAAIDWLDAYRAGDLDAILKMHADDAVIHCGCGTMKTISGEETLRAYWVERLQEYPASDLDNVHPLQDGSLISYVTCMGVVDARLTFDASGRIVLIDCAPASRTIEASSPEDGFDG